MAKNNNELLIKMFSLLLVSSLILGGCASSASDISQSDSSSDNVTTSQAQLAIAKENKSNKEMSNNLPQLEGMAKVELQVNGSPIIIELNGGQMHQ